MNVFVGGIVKAMRAVVTIVLLVSSFYADAVKIVVMSRFIHPCTDRKNGEDICLTLLQDYLCTSAELSPMLM